VFPESTEEARVDRRDLEIVVEEDFGGVHCGGTSGEVGFCCFDARNIENCQS